MIIPKYIALESKWNRKILRYTNEVETMKGFLKVNGEDVANPRSKFEVERAKCDHELVHIKCCYNNKYWISWVNRDQWVVATADQVEEDQSKATCTLFRPQYDSRESAFSFQHVHRGYKVSLWRTKDSINFEDALYCDYHLRNIDGSDLFTVIDWHSLMFLPKHVAFKSDNGYYLTAIWEEGHQYLQFSCEDIGDPRVPNETFMTSFGAIRIKSEYHGLFWRRDPNWIWADSTDASSKHNADTWFWPVKVDDNHVALMCLGNNKYLKRVNVEGKSECLNADTSTITIHARLKIEEAVISRNIYNVNYQLSNARVYDQTVMLMATQNAINRTSQTETMTLKFTCTETKSSTLESSTTWKLAAQTNLKAGFPFIVDGKISISAEFSRAYKWGETCTSTKSLETTHVVTVPPMSKVEVSLLSTQGFCDIPFSYTQHDVLTDGRQVFNDFDDGIYTGINAYNFKYESKETRL